MWPNLTSTMSNNKLDPWTRWGRHFKSPALFKTCKTNVERFFNHHNTSAETVLLLAGRTPSGTPQLEIEKMVEEYLDWLNGQGYAHSTVANKAGSILSFLRFNNVRVDIDRRKYPLNATYEGQGPQGPKILTQEEVRTMIHNARGKDPLNCLEKQAVICVEAQTAQRISILTCLRFNMIKRHRQNGREYGIIAVGPNWPGNKSGMPYKFGLHWQSMKLIDEIKTQRKAKNDDLVWTMNSSGRYMKRISRVRRMQEAVSYAAKDAGIQGFQVRKLKIRGKKKFKWSDVHAHTFRRFWVDQMYAAKVLSPDFNDKLRENQLGHRLEAITYYWGMISDEKIVNAIEQAEKQLRVLPESMEQSA
jgi:integrase